MKSVFAYIRVSTVKQGERGSSLQEQKFAIEAYASRNHLGIIRWFEEQETAAKRGRHVFNDMLALLRKGIATGVIIHKIDRGARNLRDWADIGDLIDQGVEVHFAHETLDLQSRGGRLSADIQAVVAADYIRNLRDEVLKGFYGRLKQGFFPLPAPLGYLNQGGGKAKILDPAKAPFVRRVFELYATGKYSLVMLLHEIEQMGLRNRRGGKVSLTGVSSMLNNEFYIGIIHLRKTGERFKGAHPPLVPLPLFEAVQERLSGKRKNRGLKYDFLYRKTLRCASCGYNLVGEIQKGNTYYRCHTRTCPRTCLREDEIEFQARAALNFLRYHPDDYESLAHEIQLLELDYAGKREGLIKAATLQLTQNEARLARLTDAYVDQVIEKDLFETRKKAFLVERIRVEERIEKLRNGETGADEWVRKILEPLERLSNRENPIQPFDIRDLLKKVTSNLQVDQDLLLFDWKTPFGVLVDSGGLSNGGPYRSASRICTLSGTSSPSFKRGKRVMHRVARNVFSRIKHEVKKNPPLLLPFPQTSKKHPPRSSDGRFHTPPQGIPGSCA